MWFVSCYLLRLHVKRRSAKTRQPVLTSLYRSVYMPESHSRMADALVNISCAGQLVIKGLNGVVKHVHWLQISWLWQLLFMLLMKLVLWIMDHVAPCKIHPWQMCIDVYSMRWCHMCKVTGMQIWQRFPKHNAEKHFGDYCIILHVPASA